ncbi:MAG: copper resistance protein CopC [Candidatus Binataceae bacterium]|nr:copper resistance protein CopC [Candidatus Binataceae bacterium]
MKWPGLLLTLCMTLPLEAGIAFAHAFPASEQPKVGSMVQTPPSTVSITFDDSIEQSSVRLDVFDSNGNQEAAGPPQVEKHGHRLLVPVKKLPAGIYTVRWSVTAKDGHPTEGAYEFTVKDSGK